MWGVLVFWDGDYPVPIYQIAASTLRFLSISDVVFAVFCSFYFYTQ